MKDKVVMNSESYEKRLSEELSEYQEKETKLQLELVELKENNKKLKQLNISDVEENKYLKNKCEDLEHKVEQTLKKFKQ